VSIIRRIDANWYEGHIGHKEGIFPVQYIQVLKEPETSKKFVEHRFKKSFFLKFEMPNFFYIYLHFFQY
jgi:hypothetical protein